MQDPEDTAAESAGTGPAGETQPEASEAETQAIDVTGDSSVPAPKPEGEAKSPESPRTSPEAKPTRKAPEAGSTAPTTSADDAETVALPTSPPPPRPVDATTRIPADAAKAAGPEGEVPPSEEKTAAIPLAGGATPPPPRPAQPAQPRPVQQPPRPARPAPAPFPAQKAAPERVLPRTQESPTRVEPRPSGGKRGWVITASVAGLVVLIALGVTGIVLVNQHRTANSPEAQVQTSIDTFVTALGDGDLETLRTTTCGSLAEYYNGLTEEEFATVHRAAVAQQNVPVVGPVDAIEITGDVAIAQVPAQTAATPGEQSWRTFDLARVDDQWKVCDPQ